MTIRADLNPLLPPPYMTLDPFEPMHTSTRRPPALVQCGPPGHWRSIVPLGIAAIRVGLRLVLRACRESTAREGLLSHATVRSRS